MIKVFNDICISGFPAHTQIEQRLSANGFVKKERGIWDHPNYGALAPNRSGNREIKSCSLVSRDDLKSIGVADQLQRSIGQLGIAVTTAERHGVRLSVDFVQSGRKGRVTVDPARGGRAVLAVFPLEEK
ncbi:hypothetical protein GCM10007385_37410 [Tateyamaria omphalii]|nr:hypothetical protein GCM10007385_37410 [Tateyamaria omphalii]